MIYNTIQGDTWDSISYRVYGSELYTNELFTANPQHQHIEVFSANITLNTPEIITAVNTQLPPWMRPDATSDTLNDSQLLDLINNYDSGYPFLLSYRFIDRYTKRITDSSRLGF